jgi:avirulence D protein (AvrD)
VSMATAGGTWADIDEVLGPKEERFFGSVFRSARQSLEVNLAPSGPYRLAIDGTAHVAYERGWGTRNGAARVPHVSSIDALILAGRVMARVQRYLWDRELLPAERHLAVERVQVNAGTEPDERLTDLACTGSAAYAGLAEGTPVRCDLRIGQMRARLVARHAPGHPIDPEDVGSGHVPTVPITDVVLDPSLRAVRGDLGGDPDCGPPSVRGYASSMVASAQLAQVLIAFRDQVPRHRGNTLWMRRFGCTWTEDAGPPDRRVRVGVTRHERLALAGREWSIVDGSATGPSITADYSVAHDVTSLT